MSTFDVHTDMYGRPKGMLEHMNYDNAELLRIHQQLTRCDYHNGETKPIKVLRPGEVTVEVNESNPMSITIRSKVSSEDIVFDEYGNPRFIKMGGELYELIKSANKKNDI